MAKKTKGKMKTIGTAGRTHRMGTGISVESIQINVYGRSVREIMRGKEAQDAVLWHATRIMDTARIMLASSTQIGAEYVVHPRVLRVSAHAFVDPANYQAILAQHYYHVLETAFWMVEGGGG